MKAWESVSTVSGIFSVSVFRLWLFGDLARVLALSHSVETPNLSVPVKLGSTIESSTVSSEV